MPYDPKDWDEWKFYAMLFISGALVTTLARLA